MNTTVTGAHRRRWQDLSPRQQAAILTLASIQLSLAATAWTNLACRRADQVDGSRTRWAAIIGISFIGPALYFARGRKRGAPRKRS